MSGKKTELAVILHGIGMSPMRMAFMHYALHRADFDTMNVGYPSLRRPIEDCAGHVADKIKRRDVSRYSKMHFVTHSMGSLVAMELPQQKHLPKIGRAVMIAPPYRGSEVADMLSNYRIYNRFFGPAGMQLTTMSRKNKIYVWDEGVEIGVIAGARAYEYPFFLSTMKKTGVHDGLVSLASTQIPGIKDHITLRLSHSFLIEKSASQAVHFLRHGCFKRAP